MAQNSKFLQVMGMAKAQQDVTRQLQSSKQKNSKPKKAVATPKTLRRSSRLCDAPVRIAVAEKRRLREEKRKQKIGIDASKRTRYLVARRRREAAVAAEAAERSLRAEHRANQWYHPSGWYLQWKKMKFILRVSIFAYFIVLNCELATT